MAETLPLGGGAPAAAPQLDEAERLERDVPAGILSQAPAVIGRRLRMAGWSADEAGNLVAWLSGLAIGRRAWTVNEVERLQFVRSMAETGRLKS